ncbi:MAG TPA: hypothetical protein VGI39_32145 [Polyangiaceae bacterium]|jgi:hypothetical protein
MRYGWSLLLLCATACAAHTSATPTDAGTDAGHDAGPAQPLPTPGSLSDAGPPQEPRPGWKCNIAVPGYACDCTDNNVTYVDPECPPETEEVCCSCAHTCACFAEEFIADTGKGCEELANCAAGTATDVPYCP